MTDETWKFNVIFGINKHALHDKLADHPIVCRLVERELVSNTILNTVVLKNIPASLKRKRHIHISNVKQIYTVHARDDKVVRGSRFEMQQLLKLLDDDHYALEYIVCKDKIIVRDIFWSHPDFVKLFNTFLSVLIIDSKYQTNKYRFPLLEIVGVTSTKMTYLVDFPFSKSEIEDNATWDLEM